MRWTSDVEESDARARLNRALQRIGIPLALPSISRERPHPLVAATSRRCHSASTNELFTDVGGADDPPLEVCVPRLRLCGAT